ncbi:MAG: protein-disulfide reductase DsbD, partial [Burkholderiales bacterium]|nr:protein-disulfide reductase DsbD [Burkholderiales bacterium]
MLPVSIKNPNAQQFKLTVIAQGCADAGLCYPPITQIAEIKLAAVARSKASAVVAVASAIKPVVIIENPVIKVSLASASEVFVLPVATNAVPQAVVSDTGQINSLLGSGNLTLILFSFFGFGLLLALTPCVFPMMPILSGIIIGHGDKISKKRAFVLSLFYVLGMAISYAAAGVAAGLSGSMLSAALQNIWVLGAFALVFVLLSLSMFGFY